MKIGKFVSRFVLTIFSGMNAAKQANCFCVFNSSAEPDAFAPAGYLKKFVYNMFTHFAEIIILKNLSKQTKYKRDRLAREKLLKFELIS